MNPQKEIPVLGDDGFYLGESVAIMQVRILNKLSAYRKPPGHIIDILTFVYSICATNTTQTVACIQRTRRNELLLIIACASTWGSITILSVSTR